MSESKQRQQGSLPQQHSQPSQERLVLPIPFPVKELEDGAVWRKGQAVEVVSRFLQRGGDINLQNKKGLTIAHYATYYGDEQVLRMLSEHGGVDLTVRTVETWNWYKENYLRRGSTPLDTAKQWGKGEKGDPNKVARLLKLLTYAGEWEGEKRHGRGRQLYESGAVYEGQWKNDYRHGNGAWTHGDMGCLDGMWQDDNFCGTGRQVFPDGTVYEGGWMKGQRQGEGTCTWLNGMSYTGQWKDDLFHGYGVYQDENGNKYEGEWVKGLRNGDGAQHYHDGSVYRGAWRDDLYHGEGSLVTGSTGDVYSGSFENGKRHGRGRMQYRFDSGFEGVWVHGKRHGCGVFTWPNGAQTFREYCLGKLILGGIRVEPQAPGVSDVTAASAAAPTSTALTEEKKSDELP